MKYKNINLILGTVILIIIVGVFSYQPKQVLSSAPSGLPANVSTSSVALVGPTTDRKFLNIIATSTNCSARIITTFDRPINLLFSDYAGQNPTVTYGHFQATSTTVEYDGGIYGCGLVRAFGITASSTITITETR